MRARFRKLDRPRVLSSGAFNPAVHMVSLQKARGEFAPGLAGKKMDG